jgi:hypothetical protein|tara:strand:+ start:523 stop:702 length:180 start_codon:yes stop_codon:yes gene_type:complete
MKKLRHLPLLSNFYGQPQQLLNKILCPPNGDLVGVGGTKPATGLAELIDSPRHIKSSVD